MNQPGSDSSETASGTTTSELPVVVQQPGSIESGTDGGSAASTTATGTGTDAGNGEEEEVDSSNGAGKSARQGFSVVAAFVTFVTAVLLA